MTDESKSLPVHVAACAERYKTLFNRLQRIERQLGQVLWAGFGLGGSIIAFLLGIIGYLLTNGAPWQ